MFRFVELGETAQSQVHEILWPQRPRLCLLRAIASSFSMRWSDITYYILHRFTYVRLMGLMAVIPINQLLCVCVCWFCNIILCYMCTYIAAFLLYWLPYNLFKLLFTSYMHIVFKFFVTVILLLSGMWSLTKWHWQRNSFVIMWPLMVYSVYAEPGTFQHSNFVIEIYF